MKKSIGGKTLREVRVKALIFFLCAAPAILLGLSLGEEIIFPAPVLAWGACGLTAFFFIGWFLGKSGRNRRWTFALALPLLFFSAWIAGILDLQAAYRDCLTNTDQLRADLIQYRDQRGHFPLFLDLLDLPRLPGNRLFGKSILHYDFGIKSFRLYFSPHPRTKLWNSCSSPHQK